jgi:hypothetical protein
MASAIMIKTAQQKKRPTKRAMGAGDCRFAAYGTLRVALTFFCSQVESTLARNPLTQTVG